MHHNENNNPLFPKSSTQEIQKAINYIIPLKTTECTQFQAFYLGRVIRYE